MKLNVSLNDELVEKIDNYADKNYMTRSGFIAFATNQYLNQVEIMNVMKEMNVALKKISEINEIDEESKKTLEMFEKLVKTSA